MDIDQGLIANLENSEHDNDIVEILLSVMKPNESGTSNHWMIHLVPTSESSVRLDARVSYGVQARVCVNQLSYRVSNRAVHVESLELGNTTSTIKEVIEMLDEAGFGSYTLTQNLKGCRYWVIRVIEFLKERDIIEEVDVDAIVRVAYNRDGSVFGEIEPEQGSFN